MKRIRIISLALVILMTMCLFSCRKIKTEDFYLEYDGDCEEIIISIDSSDGRLEKIVTDKEDIERVVYYLNNTKFKAYDIYNICPEPIENTSVYVLIKDNAANCCVYCYPDRVSISGDIRGMRAGKNFEKGLLELYKSIDAPEGKRPIIEFGVR